MSNADTVNAIITNLKTILAAGGYQIEDSGPGSDKQLLTAAAVQISYTGESYDDSFGQRPSFGEVMVNFIITFTETDPSSRRAKHIAHVHFLRDGITVDALNIGLLAASKLVSAVRTETIDATYERPFGELVYAMKIRYREV